MTDLLPPSDYEGELLCIRCGIGEGTGNRYVICADPGWSHEDTCEIYRYNLERLCNQCELFMEAVTDA